MQSFDLWLFQALNGLAGRSRLLDGLARLAVNDYLMPSAIVLMLIWVWLRGRDSAERQLDTRTVVTAVAAQFIANVTLKVINLAYFRARPFDGMPDVHLLFYRPWDSSCPSNPATFSFAIATAIYLRDRHLGAAALSVASVWSISRVLCGVHFPADVLAGAALGASISYWLSRRSLVMSLAAARLSSLLRKGLLA